MDDAAIAAIKAQAARYIQPCPDNGTSHDCNEEYIMWMPTTVFDTLITEALTNACT